MSLIEDNLNKVLSTLPQGVRLVAVSKFHPADMVREAYDAGQRLFGENRPQELKEKYALLPKDIEWHMIGHLQTNKVKYIAPFVAMIESLDSERLAETIDKEAAKCGRTIDCLLEIHVAREQTKSGWDFTELEQFIRAGGFNAYPNIRIRGVMGMATFTDDAAVVRGDFMRLAECKRILAPYFGPEFDTLSMGMSEDYPIAVECGAKFIVSPGFDEEVVRWCVENGVAVTPGCVTPTEIMAAMKLGLNVVKFFPAGVYGGLSAMKALSGPFGGIKFIPTGGVNTQNIGEFIAAPFIHAVGGSWVCPKADIAAGNFEKITALCKQARSAALGFEVAHIGVNCEDAAAASAVCEKLNEAFDLPVKDGSSSMFASSGIEVMKTMFKGKNGHIAIRTNSVELAVAELAKKGFAYDESSAKYKNGRMTVAYLKDEFGGFAVHLLQK